MGNTKKRLKVTAYNYIKNKIIFCDLVPGAIIQENSIAEELSISRTPVREALLELEKEGYVDIFPRQATTVSKISLNDINEIIQIRFIVEVQCLEMISTPLESEAQKQLEEYKILFQNFVDNNYENYIEFLQSDYEFHVFLVGLLRNRQLTIYCDKLLQKTLRFWHMMILNTRSRIIDSSLEHIEMIDYLLVNDTAKAAKSLEAHILVSKDSIYIIDR